MNKILALVSLIAATLIIASFNTQATAASSTVVTQKQFQKLQEQVASLKNDLNDSRKKIEVLEAFINVETNKRILNLETKTDSIEVLLAGMTASEIEWLALNSGTRRCGSNGVSLGALSIPNSSNALARCTGLVLVKKPS